MLPKSVHRILKRIFDFLRRMMPRNAPNANDDPSNRAVEPYTFQPFRYEQLVPNKKSRVPYPRSGQRIGSDSVNFYSFGGYNPVNHDEAETDEFLVQSFPLFQEMWRFNFASKEWTRYPNSHTLPSELVSNALLLHHNVLMVYGGTGAPFGDRCSNLLFVCRVNERDGFMDEVATTGQRPLPLYGQAIVYHNDYLYTIGGTTGLVYTCDIHRLHLKTLVWEKVYLCQGLGFYEPTGRYRHEVACDDKSIFILGGGTAFEAFDLKAIPVFDLETAVWHEQKTMGDVPHPRRCHGAVQVTTATGVQAFIAGGHDGETAFDDLWRLDLTTFRWTQIDKCRLPYPTYFHGMAASPEGRLVIFGGICMKGNETWRTNATFSTWLCVPKLSELCWEAVLHYSPQIAECSKEELVDLGLPRHFMQRVDYEARSERDSDGA